MPERSLNSLISNESKGMSEGMLIPGLGGDVVPHFNKQFSSPLHGLPILIKGNIGTADKLHTIG